MRNRTPRPDRLAGELLVLEAMRGDLAAFEQLVALWQQRLWQHAFALAAWSFLSADDTASTKSLILYAVVFLFGAQAVGTSKFFLFTSQQSFSLQKALLRAQMTWGGSRSD